MKSMTPYLNLKMKKNENLSGKFITMTNGVGYLESSKVYCLVYKGKGAPWDGLENKIICCHKKDYTLWSYAEDPVNLIILENLIRWDS